MCLKKLQFILNLIVTINNFFKQTDGFFRKEKNNYCKMGTCLQELWNRKHHRLVGIGSLVIQAVQTDARNKQISEREVNASCRTLSTNLGPPAGAGEGVGEAAAGSAVAAARADWVSVSAPYWRRSCTKHMAREVRLEQNHTAGKRT